MKRNKKTNKTNGSKPIDLETMQKVKSLQQKMTADFIDYCNLNGVNLLQWYRWQLHLIWQRRKDQRDSERKVILTK